MMKRVFWLATLVFAVVLAPAVLLMPAKASAEVELVVWHAYRGPAQAAFDKAVAGFNRQHVDDVMVSALAVPRDAFADSMAAVVARGAGPDVFVCAHDRIGGWVEAGGTIAPIDFYLEDEAIAAFIPSTMAAMQYQGSTYGLPVTFETVTMIYNTDLVQTAPRTSGELIAVARAHTSAAGGTYGLAYPYGDFFHHSALMNAFGGGLFDAGGRPVLNRPENVQSLALMIKWRDVDEVLPSDPSSSLVAELFNRGAAAIVFAGPWLLAEIGGDIPYALATLPTVDEAAGAPMRPWLTVEGAYVAAACRQQDYAFDVVRYLAGVDVGKMMAVEGRRPSANELVYADADVAADAASSAFREQVEYSVLTPSCAEMPLVWSPLEAAISSIERGAASPRTAMDHAQQEVEDRIRSLER